MVIFGLSVLMVRACISDKESLITISLAQAGRVLKVNCSWSKLEIAKFMVSLWTTLYGEESMWVLKTR
jgi:hypothetical protein